MKLYFVTDNGFKRTEASGYVKEVESTIVLQPVDYKIQEIMSYELESIVRDKCIKAYDYLRTPCVVEHGGLYIDYLGGLPAGLSKVMWDKIGGKMCDLIPSGEVRDATAKIVIGYCNGKGIELFIGETRGKISDKAKGNYKFQWDPIFIPEGETRTFSEMGFPEKGKYSPAKKAWVKLVTELNRSQNPKKV